MYGIVRLLVGTLFVLSPVVAAAQESPSKALQVEGDIGLVSTAGNTEVTTLNVGERITWTRGRFKITQRFGVVYGTTGDSTTTNQWKASLRYDVALGDGFASFVRGTFERNTTAGISRRFEEAVGLAATLLARPHTTLETELGVALNQQTSTTGTTDDFASGRLAVLFRQDVTSSAYVTQDLEALPNLNDTDDLRVNSESALTAAVSSAVSVKLSYTIKFDNVPEPGFERTDRIFSGGVQVTF